ncbi:unnamed protein product [Paramecium sonneborni]|uniref:Ubiquitin-like protease family profile domain-containing protein n=1 Tax=Paramecium sonneborni TaxID=65129 RepID=A0A8S1PYU2_9CILI|nr:unnamed protein product [Paramecium sonneborni]
MNQPENQQEQKQIKIDEVVFLTSQEFRKFIQQNVSDQQEEIIMNQNSKQSKNSQSFIQNRKLLNPSQENQIKYFQFIDEEYQKLQIPCSNKLKNYKLEHKDDKLDYQQNDLKQEQMKQKQSKNQINHLICQTDNQKQISEQNNQSEKVVPTKNKAIKIIEQEIQQIQSNNKVNQNQNRIIEEIQENKSLNNCQEIVKEQQQNQIIQPIQLQFQEQNQNKKLKKYERYDEIRDEQNQLVLQLRKFEIKIFQNDNQVQTIRNENFEEYYQFSLDLEKQKNCISDSRFPLIRFNQEIGLKDKQILINSKLFVTSSIINAYANYLQAVDENYYFSLKSKERKKHQRLFIFRSDFLTNCNLKDYHLSDQNNKKKLIYLMLDYLKSFKNIQYQFWLIYKKIAFIVNQNNLHWYLAVLDIQDGCLKIYDSIPKEAFYYSQLKNLLQFLFSYISLKSLQFNIFVCPTWIKQKDYYSCGYHTCLALEYLSQNEANSQPLTKEKIQDILIELLLKEEPGKLENFSFDDQQ